jgi:HK97 family phage portal protein
LAGDDEPAYSPVLRKPNDYQTRIQFLETWMNSKLLRGNTYVLKRRDGRGVVNALYVLNPDRVQPLVSDDGQIFYRLSQDNLSALTESETIVPAREIIHDRFNTLFHPLVGISPLYANALLATKAQSLEQAAANLAANGIRPGGLVTFPGNIPPEEAQRIKETWGSQYSGPSGASRLAVLGNAAKFEAMTMTSVDAQVVEQLKYTAEMVCSAYHVPPFIIGVGAEPGAGGVQDRTLRYYTQCIQKHFEDIEACLDDGLGMDGVTIGTEFDVDNLLRLDSATQMDVLDKGGTISRRTTAARSSVTGRSLAAIASIGSNRTSRSRLSPSVTLRTIRSAKQPLPRHRNPQTIPPLQRQWLRWSLTPFGRS